MNNKDSTFREAILLVGSLLYLGAMFGLIFFWLPDIILPAVVEVGGGYLPGTIKRIFAAAAMVFVGYFVGMMGLA